jgi:hypothetical protein
MLRRMDSGLALRAPRNDADAHYRLYCLSGPRQAGLLLPSLSLKGRAERSGATLRPCSPDAPWTMHAGKRKHGRKVTPHVPHTTVLSACNSQRGHGLGLLTERLARHVAGSLGRPPRLRVVVLSLLCGRAPQPAHTRTKGPHTRRGPSHPAPRRQRDRHAPCRNGTGGS